MVIRSLTIAAWLGIGLATGSALAQGADIAAPVAPAIPEIFADPVAVDSTSPVGGFITAMELEMLPPEIAGVCARLGIEIPDNEAVALGMIGGVDALEGDNDTGSFPSDDDILDLVAAAGFTMPGSFTNEDRAVVFDRAVEAALRRLYNIDGSSAGAEEAVKGVLTRHSCNADIVDGIAFSDYVGGPQDRSGAFPPPQNVCAAGDYRSGSQAFSPSAGGQLTINIDVGALLAGGQGAGATPAGIAVNVDEPVFPSPARLSDALRGIFLDGLPGVPGADGRDPDYAATLALMSGTEPSCDLEKDVASERWSTLEFTGECADAIAQMQQICRGELNSLAEFMAQNPDPERADFWGWLTRLNPVLRAIGIAVGIYAIFEGKKQRAADQAPQTQPQNAQALQQVADRQAIAMADTILKGQITALTDQIKGVDDRRLETAAAINANEAEIAKYEANGQTAGTHELRQRAELAARAADLDRQRADLQAKKTAATQRLEAIQTNPAEARKVIEESGQVPPGSQFLDSDTIVLYESFRQNVWLPAISQVANRVNACLGTTPEQGMGLDPAPNVGPVGGATCNVEGALADLNELGRPRLEAGMGVDPNAPLPVFDEAARFNAVISTALDCDGPCPPEAVDEHLRQNGYDGGTLEFCHLHPEVGFCTTSLMDQYAQRLLESSNDPMRALLEGYRSNGLEMILPGSAERAPSSPAVIRSIVAP